MEKEKDMDKSNGYTMPYDLQNAMYNEMFKQKIITDNTQNIKITRTPNADTRTATKPLDRETLLDSSKEHIVHVAKAMQFFSDMLLEASMMHDWTKIFYIDEFVDDAASTMKCGNDFTKLQWYQRHINTERHHVLDRCPDDVNLIDLLERIADIVMAGMARSGKIYDVTMPDEILQKAYKNTIELLKFKVQVVENTSSK